MEVSKGDCSMKILITIGRWFFGFIAVWQILTLLPGIKLIPHLGILDDNELATLAASVIIKLAAFAISGGIYYGLTKLSKRKSSAQ